MGLKRERARKDAQRTRSVNRPRQHRLMAAMDAVEISNGQRRRRSGDGKIALNVHAQPRLKPRIVTCLVGNKRNAASLGGAEEAMAAQTHVDFITDTDMQVEKAIFAEIGVNRFTIIGAFELDAHARTKRKKSFTTAFSALPVFSCRISTSWGRT